MLFKILSQGSRFAALPTLASGPLCAAMAPLAAFALLNYAGSQLMEED